MTMTLSARHHNQAELASKDAPVARVYQALRDLLASDGEVDKRRRALYVEIYNNAVTDRSIALEMLDEVRSQIEDPSSHAVLGQQATRCLERCNKANDQLLRLAELIASESNRRSGFDAESVFEKIKASG